VLYRKKCSIGYLFLFLCIFRSTTVNQTPGGVTIVKVGGMGSSSNGGIDKGSGGTLNAAIQQPASGVSGMHPFHGNNHHHHRLTPTRMKFSLGLSVTDVAPHTRSTGRLANSSAFGGNVLSPVVLSAFQPPSAAASSRDRPKLLSNREFWKFEDRKHLLLVKLTYHRNDSIATYQNQSRCIRLISMQKNQFRFIRANSRYNFSKQIISSLSNQAQCDKSISIY
jgi:hypothetical protein